MINYVIIFSKIIEVQRNSKTTKTKFSFLFQSFESMSFVMATSNSRWIRAMYYDWSISIRFSSNFLWIRTKWSRFSVSKKNEPDEKYLMSIVEVKTLDRCLVVNNHHQSNDQFTTKLNLQGKFIFIDSKFVRFRKTNENFDFDFWQKKNSRVSWLHFLRINWSYTFRFCSSRWFANYQSSSSNLYEWFSRFQFENWALFFVFSRRERNGKWEKWIVSISK